MDSDLHALPPFYGRRSLCLNSYDALNYVPSPALFNNLPVAASWKDRKRSARENGVSTS